jgi:hypothetical protein|tara:strand:+ start:833 stop:964 length:132 start_codon:yes stop_codon:yes gene_type:complete
MMKTQKAETALNLENTNLDKRRKSRKFSKKFTEWFRNFLENSE